MAWARCTGKSGEGKGEGKYLPGVQALVCRASVGGKLTEELSRRLSQVTRLSALPWGYLFAERLPFFPTVAVTNAIEYFLWF